MRAVYGVVCNVKAYPSTGVCRIEIEIPVEQHREATNLLFGERVLVTLAPELPGRGFGIVDADSEPAPEPPATPPVVAPATPPVVAPKPKGAKPPRNITPAMWLGMRAEEPEFWRFLEAYCHKVPCVPPFDPAPGKINDPDKAAIITRAVLQVESRGHVVPSNTRAMARFNDLRLHYARFCSSGRLAA